MSIPYHIVHDQQLVVATPRGVLTDADIFGYQREVWSRPDTSGYVELINLTEVSKIEYFSIARVSDLAKLSASMDSSSSPSKLAFIATTDIQFGLGHMYESWRQLAKHNTKAVRIFRNLQEALHWLGVRIKKY